METAKYVVLDEFTVKKNNGPKTVQRGEVMCLTEEQAGVLLAGWVANQTLPDATTASANIHALELRIGCPRLATIPWHKDISAKFVANHLII